MLQAPHHAYALPIHWLRLQQIQQDRWKPGLAVDVTPAIWQRWSDLLREDPLVRATLHTPSAALAGSIRQFIVESLVAERIRDHLALGVLVPSGYVIDKVLRLLSYLPPNPVFTQRVMSLTTSSSAREEWCQPFRATWALSWGSPTCEHGVSMTQADRRAGIFLRWLRYAHEMLGSAEHIVVVNMDETHVGAVKALKCGFMESSLGRQDVDMTVLAAERPLGRTSLMATVSYPGHDTVWMTRYRQQSRFRVSGI